MDEHRAAARLERSGATNEDAEAKRRPPSAKRIVVALAIAVAWSLAWGAGSYAFFSSATDSSSELAAVLDLPVGAEPGRDARFEATVAPGPVVLAPFSGRPCLVSLTLVVLTGTYRDSQDRAQLTSTTAAERRRGPPTILLDAAGSTGGATRVELATEAWRPTMNPDVQESVDEVPANLEVSDSEIAAARSRLRTDSRRAASAGTSIEEWTLSAGARVFVVGHVEERDGRLRVAPSKALGKVIFVADTEEGYLRSSRSSAKGLRIAGGAFIGLASLPWLIALAVVLLARRKRGASATSPEAPRARRRP